MKNISKTLLFFSLLLSFSPTMADQERIKPIQKIDEKSVHVFKGRATSISRVSEKAEHVADQPDVVFGEYEVIFSVSEIKKGWCGDVVDKTTESRVRFWKTDDIRFEGDQPPSIEVGKTYWIFSEKADKIDNVGWVAYIGNHQHAREATIDVEKKMDAIKKSDVIDMARRIIEGYPVSVYMMDSMHQKLSSILEMKNGNPREFIFSLLCTGKSEIHEMLPEAEKKIKTGFFDAQNGEAQEDGREVRLLLFDVFGRVQARDKKEITVYSEAKLKSFFGANPGHRMALSGVREFLKKEVDIRAKDLEGRQPLHMAAWNGHVETIKSILAAGARVDAKAENDVQPIHDAAWHGQLGAVKALIAAGANPYAQTRGGATPLIIANRNGHKEVIEYLEKLISSLPK